LSYDTRGKKSLLAGEKTPKTRKRPGCGQRRLYFVAELGGGGRGGGVLAYEHKKEGESREKKLRDSAGRNSVRRGPPGGGLGSHT